MLPILANHVVLTGYGHWLPNDLRGSGSMEVRKAALRELGQVHQGRKRIQPPRAELKAFHAEAGERLEFRVKWFDAVCREVIGEAIATVVRARRYTFYACAVCSNHVHFCVRRHRDDGDTIGHMIAGTAVEFLRQRHLVPDGHRVWATTPWVVFKHDPAAIEAAVEYIERNPVKEKLPAQKWEFVTPYDGWPFARRSFR